MIGKCYENETIYSAGDRAFYFHSARRGQLRRAKLTRSRQGKWVITEMILPEAPTTHATPIANRSYQHIWQCPIEQYDFISHDIVRVFLRYPDHPRFGYQAGQCLKILLDSQTNLFLSVANAPDRARHIEFHVRNRPGNHVAARFIQALSERSHLEVQGPFGRCVLDETSLRPLLLIAAGSGFSQIKSLLERALVLKHRRRIRLYWGGRCPDDLYHHSMLQRWARTIPHFDYTPVLSRLSPDSDWQGKTGYVQNALLADDIDLTGYEAYLCGPRKMVLETYGLLHMHTALMAVNIHADNLEPS